MAIPKYLSTIRRAASYVRSRARSRKPKVAVVLGSGLSSAVPELRDTTVIDYRKIPGLPPPSVKGHSGTLSLGRFARKRGSLEVAILGGRFHYYEGHPMSAITLPVRVMRELGVETLILTSAVGSMNPALKPGHICVLKDHINFMGANSLRGLHTAEYGEMFPDLCTAYPAPLRKIALAECRRLRIPAREGVYTAAPGPSYETPAEIRAYRRLGGDVVGMSVVPEVIVARQAGLNILGLSWISNMAAGTTKEALSHHDVLALGKRMTSRLRGLLEALFTKL